MENNFSVVLTHTGVAGVPAQACTRPWSGYVTGVRIAPMSAVLKQDSARMTLVAGTHGSPRKDAFARSGIRIAQDPPV